MRTVAAGSSWTQKKWPISKLSPSIGDDSLPANSKYWSAVSINSPGSGSISSFTPTCSAWATTGLSVSTKSASAAAQLAPGGTGPTRFRLSHAGGPQVAGQRQRTRCVIDADLAIVRVWARSRRGASIFAAESLDSMHHEGVDVGHGQVHGWPGRRGGRRVALAIGTLARREAHPPSPLRPCKPICANRATASANEWFRYALVLNASFMGGSGRGGRQGGVLCGAGGGRSRSPRRRSSPNPARQKTKLPVGPSWSPRPAANDFWHRAPEGPGVGRLNAAAARHAAHAVHRYAHLQQWHRFASG